MKSVKSSNPCKSVIQTKEIIVKAHGGELKDGKKGKIREIRVIREREL